MKKYSVLSLLAALTLPLSLSAQSELEDKLKAVMLLFDKNQKAAYAKIDELTAAQEKLTATNIQLSAELEVAIKKAQELEQEVLMLRAKMSDAAVRQFEAAALVETTDQEVQIEQSNQPIPDFTPESFRQLEEQMEEQSTGITFKEDGTMQVNINTATEEELTELPEVERWLAKRIIQNRPYKSVWELMQENAFGRKKMDAVFPFVVVE